MSDTTVRVVLADDQDLVRAGLDMMLAGLDDIRVVGQARDGLEAVEIAAAQRPDVVLMDVRMPGVDGIEATRRIRAAAEDDLPRVVILTTFDLDSTSSPRSARAPAASCSRTHRASGSSRPCAVPPRATRSSRRR